MIYTFVVLGTLMLAVLGATLARKFLAATVLSVLLLGVSLFALAHGWELPR